VEFFKFYQDFLKSKFSHQFVKIEHFQIKHVFVFNVIDDLQESVWISPEERLDCSTTTIYPEESASSPATAFTIGRVTASAFSILSSDNIPCR
jgi:hypothetical protein